MARTTIRSEDITAGQVKAADLASDAVDTTGIQTDIAILGFKVAANGSLAKYDLVDQTVDDFQDATGVDASASTNEERDTTGKYYIGSIPGNYYGDGSLGNCTFGASSITQTSDTAAIDTVLTTGSEAGGPGTNPYGTSCLNPSATYALTVPSKNGSYDGDMVVANFKDLTINASVTLTTDQPGRGILVYVDGDCTINGALSMSARGGYSNPTASGGSDASAVSATGIRLPLLTSGGSETLSAADFAGAGNTVVAAVANQQAISSSGTIFTISRNGTAGGLPRSTLPPAGTTGGTTISTGGGGAGGDAGSGSGGAGAIGGVFGGGSGGGGCAGSDGPNGTAGTAYGGPGGNGGSAGSYSANGGGGNPGGSPSGGSNPRSGGDGTGGLIILLVSGDLTIASGGHIQSIGKNGGYSGGSTDGTGGAAGGGAFFGLHAGTLSNSGTISVIGGTNNTVQGAQVGANGGHYETQVSGGATVNDLTLVSNATTAEAVPTKGDLVMTYTNGAGTATINTDIKGWVSRDNGTTYTQFTLTDDGTTGGHTILTDHDLDISGQPSGTAMRYKITTHNQSAAKETRIQAVSLGWS
jgi:hypothetical protein